MSTPNAVFDRTEGEPDFLGSECREYCAENFTGGEELSDTFETAEECADMCVRMHKEFAEPHAGTAWRWWEEIDAIEGE